MHIKKIYINHYGPIKGLDLEIGKGIQVVWGLNEAGKTLTIDAVIKLMLGKSIKEFEHIDRVDQFPEGYLLIEDSGNREIKIDPGSSLSSYVGIEPRDFRNTFIIRNSDLTISREEEYYRAVTDRLTGMQTEKIESLMEMFKDYGRLTSASGGARLSNSREYDGIKDKRDDAGSLVSDIGEYINQARQEKIDGLELEGIRIDRQIGELKASIAEGEKKLRHFEFHELNSSLAELKSELKKYEGYKRYNDRDHEELLELKSETESAGRQAEGFRLELEGLRDSSLNLKERLLETDSSLKPYQSKTEKMESIKEQIGLASQQRAQPPAKTFLFVSAAFLALVFVSMAFLAAYREWLFLVVLLVFVALFLSFFMPYVIKLWRAGRFLAREANLLDSLSAWGYKAGNLREASSKVAGFFDQKQALEDKKNNLEKELEINKKQQQWLTKNLDQRTADIEGYRKEILGILHRLAVEDAGKLKEKLDRRKEIESAAVQLFRMLARKLDMDIGQSAGIGQIIDSMAVIERKIEQKRPPDFSGYNPEEKLSRAELNESKSLLEDLEAKKDEITEKVSRHQYRLKDFQRKFDQLAIEEHPGESFKLEIDNLQKLSRSAEMAKDFIYSIDRRFDVSIEAINILEEITEEEQLKVSDIFDTLSASDYFKRITGSRYQRVFYDSSQRMVKAEGSQLTLVAGKLSHGAYDQLYLAIRIALAEKIIDSPSFFIIDDAFIYSDRQRLERQFEVLSGLAGQGWSFIYFTVKEEVKDMAKKFSKNMILDMEG
ncbi:MAG: ATP-binding protein [Actinomycetota bacterium]